MSTHTGAVPSAGSATGHPQGGATADGLERHFRSMLPEARVLSLEELSGELWVGCVDGRHPGCVAGAPGGNAGLFILLLTAWETLRGEGLEPAAVEAFLRDYLQRFGAFYLHTDREAQDRLGSFLSRRRPSRGEPPLQGDDPLEDSGVDALLRGPGEGWEEPLLEALVAPAHVGCGHLRLLLEEPGAYGVRRELVEEVLRSFFRRLWAGDPRLILDILEGGHAEVAVVEVRTEGAPGLVTACPHFGATELFVHHPDAVARLLALHASFLAATGGIAKEEIPELVRLQEELVHRHVEATLRRLAPGLPIFDVRLRTGEGATPSGVLVQEIGRVPHEIEPNH